MYYFASDIHLGLKVGQTHATRERLFVRWLDEVSADAEAIFLVGDVFDFWYEYRRVVPKGFTRLLGKLSELTDRGVAVHFFPGNHDLWAFDYLQTECGVVLHRADYEILALAGKRVFIGHGDVFGKRGRGGRLLSRVFRSRAIQWVFSTFVHPNAAMRFGHWWSGKSRKSHAADTLDVSLTEPLIQYAREYAAMHDVDHFVFGHMHFPRDFREGNLHVINLGCWEQYPSYAVLDASGELTLRRLEAFR